MTRTRSPRLSTPRTTRPDSGEATGDDGESVIGDDANRE